MDPQPLLRITFGLTAFLAGLDKFFNLLTNWTQYVSPLSPIAPQTLMYIAGVIEIAAGLVLLSGLLTRVAAYIVAAWLLLIAIQLITTGHYFDIAVRDTVMAIGAVTLARLTEMRPVTSTTLR